MYPLHIIWSFVLGSIVFIPTRDSHTQPCVSQPSARLSLYPLVYTHFGIYITVITFIPDDRRLDESMGLTMGDCPLLDERGEGRELYLCGRAIK
jgi:hypothetical protein